MEGNDLADKLAAEAASSNQVDRAVADKHIKQHKLVKAIQLRLATISLYLPKFSFDKASTNRESINRDPKPTITELIVLSAHNLFVDHNRAWLKEGGGQEGNPGWEKYVFFGFGKSYFVQMLVLSGDAYSVFSTPGWISCVNKSPVSPSAS